MRIAFLVTTMASGGAESMAVALAERMCARGHGVLLVVLREPVPKGLKTSLPMAFLRMDRSPLRLLWGVWRGARMLRQFRPDIVHSHTFPANMTARFLLAFGLRAVGISSIHNVNEGGWLRMLAYRLTGRFSWGSVAVCRAAAERFVRLGAVPAAKCRVIPNGIGTDRFLPSADRRRAVREAMEGKEGMAGRENFVWLAVGRLAQAKDYPSLLRAFARLRRGVPASRLWVAGDGPAVRLRKLERMTEELGLKGFVRWLGGREDVAALLDAADGFVMSSAWEGMPLAVAEAMAMEKPVVATDVGGLRELLGETGRLVRPGDPVALAEAMRAVQSTCQNERQAMGAAARERARRQFGLERMTEAWEAVYREARHR